MNHLEKYVPQLKDPSAAATAKNAAAWRNAFNRQSLPGGASALKSPDFSAKPPEAASGWAKALRNTRHDNP